MTRLPAVLHDPRALLEGAFWHALHAASPGRLLEPYLRGPSAPGLPAPDLILAVGKASVPMARAALNAYPDTPTLIVKPHGPPDPAPWPTQVEVIQAGHPLPDDASVRASHAALARMRALGADQTALVLISGGGSALLCAPDGVTLAHKQALTDALLRSGADIHEINTVRKHLSAVKGGRLAQATAARVRTLLLSDVVGDPPGMIASGPTVPDPTSAADALRVLDRYHLSAPEARAHLTSGAPDTPGDLPRATHQVIGSNRTLLEAAARYLRDQGVKAVILGDTFTGEARALAAFHAQIIRSVQAHATPFAPPLVLLSGGEATVTLGPDAGRGGRNQEFALALLTELGPSGLPGVHALSAGSDGRDGSSSGTGAFLTPDSLDRAGHLGLDPLEFLARHDAHTFFQALGDVLHTGLTGHNLNDFRAVALLGSPGPRPG